MINEKVFYIILTATIILSPKVMAVNCPNGTTENVDCWSCGENCTAYLSDDAINNGKTLNITGSGDMENYAYELGITAPWRDRRQEITSAVIEGKSENSTGITSIGAWTFMVATNLKTVSIPDSVVTIEGSAFKGTSSLENINIPDSVTSIGSEAFYTSGVTNLIIPDSVTKIKYQTFAYSSLENIIIPDSVTEIADGAFNESSAVIYCTATSPCVGKGSKNIVAYEKQGGVYILDGQYYLSGADMASQTNVCAKELNECKRDVLEAKGVCQGSSCDTLIQSDGNYMLKFGGKTYQSINDLLKGNYDRRRIYTIEEANFVAGDKNRISIKYR